MKRLLPIAFLLFTNTLFAQEERVKDQQELTEIFESIIPRKNPNKHQDKPIYKEKNAGRLLVINKILSKSEYIELKIGEIKYIGDISLKLIRSIKNINPYNGNNLLLVEIKDNSVNSDNKTLFKAWLLASNPSVSVLEHPIYEIFAKKAFNLKEQEK